MASQCEPPSVWGSALIMTVPDRVIECGRRSVGNIPRNDFTFCKVHNICRVHQKSVVTTHELSMWMELSNSRYSKQVNESGNDLLKFNSTLLPLPICEV